MVKTTLIRSAVVFALIAGSIGQAQAVGCLSGAVVGGIAGHEAHHHAILGALGGCIAGHELAVHEKKIAMKKKMTAAELNAQQLNKIKDPKKTQ